MATAAPPQQAASRSPDVIAEFDVRPNGDLLTVPVTLDAGRFPFFIDTGASVWLLDASLRAQPAQRYAGTRGRLVVHGEHSRVFMLPRASIAAVLLGADIEFVFEPLRESFLLDGQDVHGAIGFQSLKDKTMCIDFDRGKLRFLRKADSDAGTAFKMDVNVSPSGREAPFIAIELSGETERFLLETGYCAHTAGTLARRTFSRLRAEGRLSRIQKADKAASVVHSAINARGACLDRFAFGPFKHEGLMFDEAEVNSLGLGYLSQFVVTFDFPTRTLYLRPGKRYGQSAEYDRAGLWIAERNGIRIMKVFPASPAEKAGLKEFDTLLSVDGTSVVGTTVFEVSRQFAQPGPRRTEVVFSRRHVEMRTTVVINEDND